MSSPQYLFNRKWSVTFRDQTNLGNFVTYNSLRTVFEIDKNVYSTSNKSKVSLYNLDLESRRRFVKGILLQLDAGYVGLTDTIFIGNVTRAYSERKGPDIITTFECGDGEQQMVYGRFDKSYPPGASYKQILQDILKAFQQIGIGVGTVLSIPQRTFNSGRTFSGTLKDALDNLLQNIGYSWSIQNMQIQIIPITGHEGQDAIVVSENTGMIGVPSLGTDFTQFTCLLNPKIVPNGLIGLFSQTITGDFKVNKIKYEGDSHGQKWQVDCECAAVSTQQTYIPNRGTDIFTGLA